MTFAPFNDRNAERARFFREPFTAKKYEQVVYQAFYVILGKALMFHAERGHARSA